MRSNLYRNMSSSLVSFRRRHTRRPLLGRPSPPPPPPPPPLVPDSPLLFFFCERIEQK
uniref:Uncharacterized protein n=1 Tax=Arundo donax TaxID=35708 RepID=A0A0A9FIN8_ARUDO